MLTVYTMTYNEEKMLAHFVRHYRSRFPSCEIHVFDHASSDMTASLAHNMGCLVHEYGAPHEVHDGRLAQWKNSVWKSATTPWVVVCDADELLNITEDQLRSEVGFGATIVRTEGYNLVSDYDGQPVEKVSKGVRAPLYDKAILFSRERIADINYDLGAHHCAPTGSVVWTGTRYPLWHMSLLDEKASLQKRKYTAARMSDYNKQRALSTQYTSGDDAVRLAYRHARANARQVRVPEGQE